MGRKSNLKAQMDRIVFLVIMENFVTASFVQRKLGITYSSAQEILKNLAQMQYIEAYKPFKKLKVLKHSFIQ